MLVFIKDEGLTKVELESLTKIPYLLKEEVLGLFKEDGSYIGPKVLVIPGGLLNPRMGFSKVSKLLCYLAIYHRKLDLTLIFCASSLDKLDKRIRLLFGVE